MISGPIPKGIDTSIISLAAFRILYELAIRGLFISGKLALQACDLEKSCGLSRNTVLRALVELDTLKIITRNYNQRYNTTYIYPCAVIRAHAPEIALLRLCGFDAASAQKLAGNRSFDEVFDAVLIYILNADKVEKPKAYVTNLIKKGCELDDIAKRFKKTRKLPPAATPMDYYEYIVSFPPIRTYNAKRNNLLGNIMNIEALLVERDNIETERLKSVIS